MSTPEKIPNLVDRLKWSARVAGTRLPATCYRMASVMAEAAVRGTAFISRRNLAVRIGCDEARLGKCFRAMVDAGFLVRGELRGTPGRQTYEWYLTTPEPGAESAPPAEDAPGAPDAGAGDAESASNEVRKAPPKDRKKKENEERNEINEKDSLRSSGAMPHEREEALFKALRELGCAIDLRDPVKRDAERAKWLEATKHLTVPEVVAIIKESSPRIEWASKFPKRQSTKSMHEHSGSSKTKQEEAEQAELNKKLLRESERRHWEGKGKSAEWIADHLQRNAAILDPKPSAEERTKRAADFASIRNAETTVGQS